MIKVQKTSYPGWNDHPVYSTQAGNWQELSSWMHKNDCDPFLLSSGSNGYVFQIRKNYAWFILRWS